MNKDLTVGNPSSVLIKFCLPLFASVIFQQLYNIADSFIAGNFLGEDALAAVGNSYEITLIYIAFAFGCNVGCSVITANFFGAKKYKEVRTSVYTTFIACAVLCAVLMTAGLLTSNLLLKLINTPANIFGDSKAYLIIYILGLPFVFFYNVSTGIYSALGDSKTPFIFLVCSSVANVGADILFVKYFNMGVPGVAWATFICQGISCILAVVFVLLRLSKMKTDEPAPIFSKKILKDIAIVAIPSTIQQSFISVGNIIIQGVINDFGSNVTAGYSAGIKINNMLITALTTLCNGMSNYVAQNIGARNLKRVKQGFTVGLRLVCGIAVVASVIYFFFGEIFVSWFIKDGSETAIKTGTTMLKIIAPFYAIAGAKLVSDSMHRGAKQMSKFMIGTFIDLALRVIISIVLSKTSFGATGIWMSWPVGWIIAASVSLAFYARTKWDKIIPNSQEQK